MAGFEWWTGTVLDRQEQTVPKKTPNIVLAYAPPSGDFTSAIKNQEQEERRQTIQETEFLTPEEKLALLSEVNTDKNVLLATSENPQGDWKDLALDIGKDLLVPNELDVAFFLATGPGWLMLKRLSKAPEVVQKLLRYFDPKALEAIERALDALVKGDSKWVQSISDVLRWASDPKKREMWQELEKLVKSKAPWEKVLIKSNETIKVQESTIEIEKVKEWYETMNKLVDTNLNRLFARWKPRYSEIRENVLSEIKNFEKRHKIKQDPEEFRQYLRELTDLLESHKVDTKNLKTLEDMKNYLLHNH